MAKPVIVPETEVPEQCQLPVQEPTESVGVQNGPEENPSNNDVDMNPSEEEITNFETEEKENSAGFKKPMSTYIFFVLYLFLMLV